MKLFYRGAQYEAQLPHLEADYIEAIGNYRGAPAIRRHFPIADRQRGHIDLVYRGVKYSQSR
ncbi:MAG: DUF4278 domain-containing protein [Leptolyngbyaceae cyanobacterium SM2_5_2]|nr:DUF4278 domain-containing protein [Leptolyngbyaceae cyanobacterium SM2_5_2]